MQTLSIHPAAMSSVRPSKPTKPARPIRLSPAQALTIRVAQRAHPDPCPFLGITAADMIADAPARTRAALVRLGLVASRIDRDGYIVYRLTRAGLALLVPPRTERDAR